MKNEKTVAAGVDPSGFTREIAPCVATSATVDAVVSDAAAAVSVDPDPGAASGAVETPSKDENGERKAASGSWYWLLAPDGSPAVASNPRSAARGSSNARPRAATTETKATDHRTAASGWYWLLAPDGIPAITNDGAAPKGRTTTEGKRGSDGSCFRREEAEGTSRTRPSLGTAAATAADTESEDEVFFTDDEEEDDCEDDCDGGGGDDANDDNEQRRQRQRSFSEKSEVDKKRKIMGSKIPTSR